jgi:FkbM family methyltransferase
MRPFQKFAYLWHHPANRGSRLRAVLRSTVWQLEKRLRGGYRDVPIAPGRKLRCYAHIDCTPLVVYATLYDYGEMNFLLRYLRSTDNFLDVGGNVGVYTVLASSVVTEGRIHVFEPAEEARAILEENIRLNGLRNVDVHPAAAGEADGRVGITRGLESMTHIVVENGGDGSDVVRQVRLDDEVGSVPFALGKVDVEGAELFVFKGAAKMLKAHNPPVWIVEFGDASARFGYGGEELARFLQKFGYRFARFEPAGNRLEWNDELWRNRSTSSPSTAIEPGRSSVTYAVTTSPMRIRIKYV